MTNIESLSTKNFRFFKQK